MDRHHRTVLTGDQIAERGPDVLALALFRGGEAHVFQLRAKRQHPRAVVPDHDVVLVEALEELFRMAELCLVRAVQTDDDTVQIGDLGQLGQNAGHRLCL